MGLFNKKPTLSPEEILSRMNAIEGKLAQQQYAEAIADATALEKEAKGYGSYHLGAAYHLGWGVKQDVDRAITYYKAATAIDNDYQKFVWYMGGLVYLNFKGEYEEAAQWLEKAESLGYTDATMHLACAYFNLAMQFRTYASRTLKMNEATQANLLATRNAIKAQNKYLEVAQNNPGKIPYDHWVCLGRCAQLLYNLACRGELSMDVTFDNSFKSWVSNSFNVVGGTMDRELHTRMLQNAALVCDVMDQGGKSIIGEYFRAACGLLDSELHHSAEAFYRVRWHLKRIGELRSQFGDEAAKIAAMLTDVDQNYAKMDKKYGAMVISMIREGKMPDLTPSYLDGKAPAPESCQNFMQMVEEVRRAPAAAPSQKEKKGLFGFLKR